MRKMKKETFKELIHVCEKYDPYIQYIDDYHQYEQAQEANASYDKWFNEIIVNYDSEYRSGVPMSRAEYGESLESKLADWLNGYFEIEIEDEEEKSAKRVWTEDEIKVLIQTNDEVLYNALKKLYACQTEDEKQTETTREHNGVGFNAYDAKFLTSVSEFLLKTGFLTSRQKMYVRKKLVKYNKQLTKLANA